MKSPIVLLRSLLIDFKRLEPGVKGLERDIITLEKRFEHEGYGFLSIALPTLGSALQQGLSTGRFCCPTGFEKIPRGTIPKLFSGMFSEVFDPITGLIKESLNFGVLTNVYQVLFLFKKIRLSAESSDKLDKDAKREFFSNDLVADQVSFPDRQLFRLSVVSRHILPSLRSMRFGTLAFKHGPGAVAEKLKANQKWKAVADGIFSDSFSTDENEYDTFATSTYVSLSETDVCKRDSSVSLQSLDYGVSRNSARLISVEKNSTSRRTITVEPVLNQFLQQGLNTALRDSILNCSILSRCLALSDQSKNQKLALEGSLTGKWSTIDLKAASDLLSLKLVNVVFGSHPDFLQAAIDCRTCNVSNNNQVTRVSKFAGMGNALTFPVQSVVFAVIAITSILDMLHKSATKGNIERVARHIRVYGDDIIVDAKYAHQVVSWLCDFGLKVNLTKSFLVGNFKESCGVDAYKGVDITPIYLKTVPQSTSSKPKDLAALVSFANTCWLAGLYETSARISELVEGIIGFPLPLVSKNSGSLGWHSRQDASYATKWCTKHHQLLVRAPVVRSRYVKDPLDGWAALLKFFHVPFIGRPLNHLKETSKRSQLKISMRWVPVRV